MIREAYHEKLDRLTQDVEKMALLVIERLDLALAALSDPNGIPATDAQRERFDSEDDIIDERCLALEKESVELLALQQPVAVDLRVIVAAFKIASDLERVGDLLLNLLEYSQALQSPQLFLTDDLVKVGGVAKEMLADAVRSFITRDSDLAQKTYARDDAVDESCRRMAERLIKGLIHLGKETMADDEAEKIVRNVAFQFLAIRDIERIADGAVNICTRTLYVTTGDQEYL
ncbi:phosphate signaling complex protein PhoU [Candidatus Bipolaricaulota bacterium]|nr:phosphate signaling complex protein PhoU [Candidatus Bipolaricaulota bacterium]